MTSDEVFEKHEPLLTALMDTTSRDAGLPAMHRFATVLDVLNVYAKEVDAIEHLTVRVASNLLLSDA